MQPQDRVPAARPVRSGEGADRPGRDAATARQLSNPGAVDAAKCCQAHRVTRPSTPREQAPAVRTESLSTGVALGLEHRGKEHQSRTGTLRSNKLGRIVRRTRHRSPQTNRRPTAAAQMQPSAQRRSQTPVSGNHQDQLTRPADACQGPSKRGTGGVAILPQHDAAQASRQARGRASRID